jgi:peroxiredoxin
MMYVVPFPPLWNVARGGQLKVGDMAPDFRLQTVDRQNLVQLSSFRRERPVVLVFGSYT